VLKKPVPSSNDRTKHGKFKSVNDLSCVKGIGPKMVKKIGKDAVASGKTAVAPKVKSKKKTKKEKITIKNLSFK